MFGERYGNWTTERTWLVKQIFTGKVIQLQVLRRESVLTYLIPESGDLTEIVLISGVVPLHVPGEVDRTLQVPGVVHRARETVGVVVGGVG